MVDQQSWQGGPLSYNPTYNWWRGPTWTYTFKGISNKTTPTSSRCSHQNHIFLLASSGLGNSRLTMFLRQSLMEVPSSPAEKTRTQIRGWSTEFPRVKHRIPTGEAQNSHGWSTKFPFQIWQFWNLVWGMMQDMALVILILESFKFFMHWVILTPIRILFFSMQIPQDFQKHILHVFDPQWEISLAPVPYITANHGVPDVHASETRWATHGKRLKGLKVAGSVERQTGGEKPFATRIAIFFWRRWTKCMRRWALCWPMSALCWPYLTVSCPKGGYVGSMFASLGPIPALC